MPRAAADPDGVNAAGLGDCDCVDVDLHVGLNATMAQTVKSLEQASPPAWIVVMLRQDLVPSVQAVVPNVGDPPHSRWRYTLLSTVVLVL